jgi:molybdate transport system substrate-binding protein
MRRRALIAGLAATPTLALAQPAGLTLFAAGSLRESMTEIAAAFTRLSSQPVRTEFGYSGLMRERIERGERADILASADMGHPLRLLRDGRATQVAMFTRNALCVVAPQGTGLSADTLVDRLLDPALPLGIYPPVQDPVGDYTLALFRRVDEQRPGAATALLRRAAIMSPAMLDRPLAPGEDLASAALRDRKLGLHVSYCTTARGRLVREVPGVEVVDLPPALTVGPEYGLALLRDAAPAAAALALFIFSIEGQRILARHGFVPVTLPSPEG